MLSRRLDDIARRNHTGIKAFFLAEVTDGYLMQLAGTTRVAAGSEHLFCFAMETLTGKGIHGEYRGVGTIMMRYLQTGDKNEVRPLLERVNAPTTATELGVKADGIVKALTMAHKMRDWYTTLGHNGLSEGAAERLARDSGVLA